MTSNGPSKQQINFARRLLKQFDEPEPDFSTMTSAEVSALIDELRNRPTPSQINYATHLLKQLGEPLPDFTKMDSREMSRLISGLKTRRGRPTWYGNGKFRGFEKDSLSRCVVDRYLHDRNLH